MTFHFLDNVLLLHLPFETAKRVLEGLALLKSDFSQRSYTPLLVPNGLVSYGKPWPSSQAECIGICAPFQKINRIASCICRGAYAFVALMKLVGR